LGHADKGLSLSVAQAMKDGASVRDDYDFPDRLDASAAGRVAGGVSQPSILDMGLRFRILWMS
jgi:hypothetical protein